MLTDTDTLVALVSSLLPSNSAHISDEDILEALVECDADVDAAVQHLNRVPRPKSKRKHHADLSDWLQNPAKRTSSAPGDGSTSTVTNNTHTPKSTRPTKTITNLLQVLRPPPPSRQPIPRFPPLTLGTPTLVEEHVPCTLHPSILPPKLACQLFHELLDASCSWRRNKWWLFERVVESPHRTFFYTRRVDQKDAKEAAQYWYNGRATDPPPEFTPTMEEACKLIERTVNDELARRPRFPLEYPGTCWQANVAAANRYEGAKESVGPHSDQMTYIGPYATIASLSLGTQRIFRLREVVPIDEEGTRHARTYNIPLLHNSLLIMHASCQERYKHSIPPQSTLDLFHPPFPPQSQTDTTQAPAPTSNVRINLTFRFYRPDFAPSTTPRCDCDVPAILRHDMRRRAGKDDRYWWTCYAGAQNEGRGCGMWKEMDLQKEGKRGSLIQ